MARSITDPIDPAAAQKADFWEAARNARPTARRRRPHLLRWILLGLVALLLLFIADLAWSGWIAYEGLRTAKVELQTGGDRLVAGDLGQADAAFQRAADAGDAAAAAFRHPAMQLLNVLPWIGDDVGARPRTVGRCRPWRDTAASCWWMPRRPPGGTANTCRGSARRSDRPCRHRAGRPRRRRGLSAAHRCRDPSGVDRPRGPPPTRRRRGHPGAGRVGPTCAPGAARGVGRGDCSPGSWAPTGRAPTSW